MPLKGQTQQHSGVSPDIQGLRNSMVGYLMGQGQQSGPPPAQVASWGTGQVGGQSLNIGQQPQQQTGPLGGVGPLDLGSASRTLKHQQTPLQGTPPGPLTGGGTPGHIPSTPSSVPAPGGYGSDQYGQFMPGIGGKVDPWGDPSSGATPNGYTNQGTPTDGRFAQPRQDQNAANQSFDRIFGQPPGMPDRVQVGGPANINPLSQVGVQGNARDVGYNPASTDFMSQFERVQPGQVGTQFGAQQIDAGQFGMPGGFNARDVNADAIGNVSTQSVDQLGGANSAFFQNMMQQLQPAFNQQRALAAAAGSEASGNLTGSGFANRLGSALNRSLGDEQARLANYAAQGLGMEVGRQTNLAGINTQRDIAGLQSGLQAQMANQQADLTRGQLGLAGGDQRLRALMANQGADLQAQGMGLQGQLANQQTGLQGMLANQDARLRAAGMGQQGELANMQAQLHAGGQNQSADLERMRLGLTAQTQNQNNELQRLLANQGMAAGRSQLQAQMDQQRNMGIYGNQSQFAMQNAQNFLNMLLGMGTSGVGAPQTSYKPGLLDVIGGVGGQILGGWAGGGFK